MEERKKEGKKTFAETERMEERKKEGKKKVEETENGRKKEGRKES